MNSKKLGVGVVGTGMAAKPHALALNDLKDIIDIKGVYSRNAEKCQLFASKYQMPFVDNIEDLVQDLNLDMVIIITPPNQRLKLIESFSSAGKHILMEKPIERTTKEAEKIVNGANIHYVANKCIKQEYQKLFQKMNPVFPVLKT